MLTRIRTATSKEENVISLETVYQWTVDDVYYGTLTEEGVAFVRKLLDAIKQENLKKDPLMKELLEYFDLEEI